MNDLVVSGIRTIVPIVVGSVLAWLAQKNFNIDKDTAVQFATGLAIALYYLVARVLERRWPAAGLLLGSKKQPAYVPPTPGVEEPPAG